MNRAMTEKQLIEELRCGNESAFRRIYDRHYVPLCRFADLFLHDTSLSEMMPSFICGNIEVRWKSPIL